MSKVYFFSGAQYCRYDTKVDAAEAGYPAAIAGAWTGLPATGVDAALNWGDGKTFFFSGGDYYRYDHKTDQVDPGYPRPIADGWAGLTLDRVDACVNGGNGKAFFFRRNQYWRYDIKQDRVDSRYPLLIGQNWPGLFDSDLDGAINWGNGKAYFFKGDQYARYDLKKDAVEGGWPKPIAGNWPGLFTTAVRAPVMLGFAGIDRLSYPGDAVMQQLWNDTNLTWTGFYLAPAPSQGDTEWMTHFTTLSTMGWGIAPLYVGRQQPEPHPSPGAHDPNGVKGLADGAAAAGLATVAGIPAGSVIYLDVETGGPLQPAMLDYYRNWVNGLVTAGFRPGVYCSFLLARQLFQADSRPAIWTFNLSRFQSGGAAQYRHPFPAPEPAFSSIEIASAWQLAQAAQLVPPAGTAIQPMDFDSCSMRDPSQIP